MTTNANGSRTDVVDPNIYAEMAGEISSDSGYASLTRYDDLPSTLSRILPLSTKVVETMGVDGTGRALWQRSDTMGVRGAASCTNNGSSLTDGEYYVRITGSGTGASARVVVVGGQVHSYSDGSCDAVLLEPGWNWGNGQVATLSKNPADWFLFDSNATPATFGGSPVFPDITFALADNLLSFRHPNGNEFLLDHDGVFSARHFGAKLDRTIDSSAALQNAWRALERGRSQISLLYGGGPQAGGILVIPGTVFGNGQTLWCNSTGTPTGTKSVGTEIQGTMRGSPRATRPDGNHAGSALVYMRVVLGDVNGTGVFTTVSRGTGISRICVLGGVEAYNLQHGSPLENLLIVPDAPMGVLASTGARHDGWGFYGKNCSLLDLRHVIVTAGKQTYFGNKNFLNGMLFDNCDHIKLTAGNAAFNIIPMWVRAPTAGVKSTVVDFDDQNFEGNVHGGPILEAVREVKGDFSVITNNDTDSSRSFVEVGSIAETAYAVTINGGSFNGTPVMSSHTLSGTPANNQITVDGDYTIRYAIGVNLTVNKGAGTVTGNVTAVAYDYASHTTTVTLDITTIDGTCTAVTPTVIPGTVGVDVINAQGAAVKGASMTNLTTAVRFRSAAKDCEYERGAWSGGTTEYQADAGMTWLGNGLTWTPAITFATPGDLSVSYGTQVGRWERIRDLLYVEWSLVFTPTFTTASGAFGITGMPFPAANSGGINMGTITNISSQFGFGTSKTMVMPYVNGTTQIGLRGMGSAQTASGLVATNLTSGAAHTLIGSAVYKI